MLSVSSLLRSSIANDFCIRQRGTTVILGRTINEHLWNYRHYRVFNGAVGFLPIEKNTSIQSPFDLLISEENSVHFSNKDLSSHESSKDLIQKVHLLASRMKNFEGQKISSAIQYDVDEVPQTSELLFQQNPLIDPCTKATLLMCEVMASEQITNLPSFKGGIALGHDFISPKLDQKIHKFFYEKSRDFVTLYPDAVDYCKKILREDDCLENTPYSTHKCIAVDQAKLLLKEFKTFKNSAELLLNRKD